MPSMIPEDQKPTLREFFGLDPAQADAFTQALAEARPALRASRVAKAIAEKGALDAERARRFMFMLAGMSRARAAAGVTIEEFVSSLVKAATDENLISSKTGSADAKQRLSLALASTAVEISSKALLVMSEIDRSYCHARILSDLRPVFSDDKPEPKAFVILHHLKLGVHGRGNYDQTEDLFVALDRSDLSKMKALIERALQKHDTLLEMANKVGLPVLGEEK